MGDFAGVLLAVALLAANAFFVGAEFALISARRDRLQALADKGKKRATTVIKAGEQLSLMLAGAQLGITICSILLGRVGEPAVAHLLEVPMEKMNVPSQLLHPISFTVALSIVVVLHILVGEMVPKNIAIAGPEKTAMLLVPAHMAFCKFVNPLIWFYNLLANLILRALRVEPKDELESTVSMGQLGDMIAESRMEGLLDEDEHRRLTQALRTQGRTVADVMIPLDKVHSVQISGAGPRLGAIEQAVAETGFSRFPVRSPNGVLTGYLHLKDVLTAVIDKNVGPLTVIPLSQVRPLPPIGADVHLDRALATMRLGGSHLAAVTNKIGRTIGIVALEDLVEEFVGTVRDSTHRAGE
jgi:CBS domain containing-hemolysin-like protein